MLTESNVPAVDYQEGGATPVSASPIAIKNGQVFSVTEKKMVNYPVPRALETDEVPDITKQAVTASRNAIDAGNAIQHWSEIIIDEVALQAGYISGHSPPADCLKISSDSWVMGLIWTPAASKT